MSISRKDAWKLGVAFLVGVTANAVWAGIAHWWPLVKAQQLAQLASYIVAAGIGVYCGSWLFPRGIVKDKTLSANNIFIASLGPVLTLSRYNSHAEIQFSVFSPVPVELLYVEARISCNSTGVSKFERSKPVMIPAFNPQQQTIEKNLTEKELKRLDQPEGTFYQIEGLARIRSPQSQDLDVNFRFLTAAWWLPSPTSAE
jgi:hypothetical protein